MSELPSLPDAVRVGLAPEVAAYIAALEAAVTALQARITELEARLGQNSTNSSRPPSSDPPGTRRAPPLPKGSRRPGGQPGHRGHFRTLRPVEQVDRVVRVTPEQCRGCGRDLPPQAAPDDPADVRHQVTDLPAAHVQVTELQLAARRCTGCGTVTRADWPAMVPRTVLGPRVLATLTLLTGRYRLSKREAAACVHDLFGAAVAVGTVSAGEQQVSAALAPIVSAARTAAQQAAVANLDETGWRQGRERAWLWTMVTAAVTVFLIDRSRGRRVVRALLGPEWTGIVGSDRFTAYKGLPLDGRQVCWAHLQRDFQKLVDAGPATRPVGEQLVAITAQVFELWHRFRAAELTRAEWEGAVSRVIAEMEAVLAVQARSGAPLAQTLCRELRAVWLALWTFVWAEGVEPTNNAAEQALRPAVLWRKGSFGTHNAAGSRFVERMLTVTATCRQQGRNVFAFLLAAITATQQGSAAPSLLPATT